MPRAAPDFTPALLVGVDLSVPSAADLTGIATCAERAWVTAAEHLKADTGLRRNGVPAVDRPELVSHARNLRRRGLVTVRGSWSHLVHADRPTTA